MVSYVSDGEEMALISISDGAKKIRDVQVHRMNGYTLVIGRVSTPDSYNVTASYKGTKFSLNANRCS